jgi:pimeloyl-ACP methyl ester carboxylesterase
LARRLQQVVAWLSQESTTRGLAVGCLANETGSAMMLQVASTATDRIRAVVSYSGRPDFAGEVLPGLRVPTLLIVGEKDAGILALNENAFKRLGGTKELTIIQRAGHRFEEAGAWERVIALATTWFQTHLRSPADMNSSPASEPAQR